MASPALGRVFVSERGVSAVQVFREPPPPAPPPPAPPRPAQPAVVPSATAGAAIAGRPTAAGATSAAASTSVTTATSSSTAATSVGAAATAPAAIPVTHDLLASLGNGARGEPGAEYDIPFNGRHTCSGWGGPCMCDYGTGHFDAQGNVRDTRALCVDDARRVLYVCTRTAVHAFDAMSSVCTHRPASTDASSSSSNGSSSKHNGKRWLYTLYETGGDGDDSNSLQRHGCVCAIALDPGCDTLYVYTCDPAHGEHVVALDLAARQKALADERARLYAAYQQAEDARGRGMTDEEYYSSAAPPFVDTSARTASGGLVRLGPFAPHSVHTYDSGGAGPCPCLRASSRHSRPIDTLVVNPLDGSLILLSSSPSLLAYDSCQIRIIE